jgi:hypothetical protein
MASPKPTKVPKKAVKQRWMANILRTSNDFLSNTAVKLNSQNYKFGISQIIIKQGKDGPFGLLYVKQWMPTFQIICHIYSHCMKDLHMEVKIMPKSLS